MDPSLITPAVIRDTLRAIRSASSLDDSPLLELEVLGRGLAAEQINDTPETRAAYLPRWLDAVVVRQVAKVRGEPVASARQVHSAEEALARLREDFEFDSEDREVWSSLHFRFFSGSQLLLLDLADELSVSRRTLRRRIARGYELLAECVRDAEREAALSAVRGHNVPAELTRFIGREAELARVRQLLAEHRFVTLTGPGGIGKSRLAVRLARDLASAFPDGAWFVELAALNEDQQVTGALLDVFGLPEQPRRSRIDVLLDHVGGKRLLLVLDNCERLVHACSRLVSVVLRQCDSVQVLATSREALDVERQALFDVPPMTLPLAHRSVEPARALHSDAVRLFGSRAMTVQPGFQVNDSNAAQVTRLCARLEGIPLAIELAAARARHLTLEQLEARLEDRFRLLRDGRHASRPGHETLRAAMDVSYELLTGPEQTLLRRLSVFRGGWTLEAAEAVCSGEDVDAAAVLELLSELEAKSLVEVRYDAQTARYRMLETVRQYAWSRLLEAGGDEALRNRHADHFRTLAERSETALKGEEQVSWLEQLEAERQNLLAAVDWLSEADMAAEGLRMASALWRFWYLRGHLQEGRVALERLLSRSDVSDDQALRAKALNAAGVLAHFQSAYEAAGELLEECLAIRRKLDDRVGLSQALNNLGMVMHETGNYRRAAELYGESASLKREFGDRHGLATALTNLAEVSTARGDLATASVAAEEGLSLRVKQADSWGLAAALSTMALIKLRQGDLDAAQTHYQQSLGLQRQLSDRQGVAQSLMWLGRIAHLKGEQSAARQHYDESLRLERQLDNLRSIAAVLRRLGELQADEGNLDLASRSLRESLMLAKDAGYDFGVAEAEEALARVLLAKGKTEEAGLRLRRSLAVLHSTNRLVDLLRTLDTVALYAAALGKSAAALDLLAATAARREAAGFACSSASKQRQDGVWRHVQGAMTRAGTSRGLDGDTTLTVDAAVELATQVLEGLPGQYQ